MASIISHPAVPLALAPLIWSMPRSGTILATGIVLSILPDADVLGYWIGIPYGSLFGHRGFSHSLVFAALAAVLAALLVVPRSTSRSAMSGANVIVVTIYFFIACASHGLLDALTNGGLGVAIASPVSTRRMFFPVQPIEVSPIGIRAFFSQWGVAVLRSELKWIWLPAVAVAFLLWGARIARARFFPHAGAS